MSLGTMPGDPCETPALKGVGWVGAMQSCPGCKKQKQKENTTNLRYIWTSTVHRPFSVRC